MDLKEKYSHFFEVETQQKGAELFSTGLVSIYESSQLYAYAEVDGDPFCEVKIDINGNTLSLDCECDIAQNGQACKHIWATICACTAFGDLEKATKRSVKKDPVIQTKKYIAPKISALQVNTEVHVTSEIVIHKGLSHIHELPHTTRDKQERAGDNIHIPSPTNPIVEREPDRELEIENTERAFQNEMHREFTVDEYAPQYQIIYIINIAESAITDTISLQTYWRQQKKDGSWSALTELMYTPGDVYPSHTDQAIMHLISSTYQKPVAKVIPSAKAIINLFILPGHMARVILMKAAETGQLFWRSSKDSTDMTSLTPNSTESTFSIEIYNVDTNDYTAQGFLSNPSDSIDVAECIHLSKSQFFISSETIGYCTYSGAYQYAKKLSYERSIFLKSWKADDFVQELLVKTSLSTDAFPEPLNYTLTEPLVIPCLYFKTAKFKYKNSEQLHVELTFNYNGTQISDTSPQTRLISGSDRQYFTRDTNAEYMAAEKMKAMSFRYCTNPNLEELGWKLHPAKLDVTVNELLEADWHIIAHGKSYRKPQDKQMSVSSSMDWFELKATVSYGDEEVPLPELMAARKRGEDHVLLGDGSFGVLPLDWLKDFTVLTEIGLTEDDLIKFKRSQSALLDALLSKHQVTFDDDKLALVNSRMNDALTVTPSEPPATFIGQLRPYQKEGLGWLLYLQKIGLSGCLADDMGLGKTVQVLALLEYRRLANTGKASLIVLPKSLIFNWQQEAEKFTPNLTVLVHTGAQRDKKGVNFKYADVVITTYGTLKRDVLLLQDRLFDYCILDESQAIKNSDTDVAKAVRLVRSDNRLTMTGTPIENHAGELLSQLDFLNPGMFGSSQLIAKFSKGSAQLSPEDFTAINQAIRPFILRRTKEEVAKDLPEKVEQVLYCELEPWQREKYEELKAYYRKELLPDSGEGEEKNQIEILEALLRLRQACCHPALINEKFHHAPSAKLELVIGKVRELIEEKHKVLMFSQFTSFLSLIRERLEHDNIKFSYLDGKTKDRAQQVKNFQENEDVEVFLISLKAGGTGLNLTAADYVFVLDPWWNPAIEAQAIDRAYRIGQKRNVFAYKLIAKNTVEEKVLEMQNQKRAVADQIINAGSNRITSISRSDLEYILE